MAKGTLKKKRDFEEVYERGLKSVGRRLVAFTLSPDPDSDASDDEVWVGVVASRKVGNAVHRSRAKRLLRAAFDELREQVPAGTRVVLVARRSIIEPSVRSQDVLAEMMDLLQRNQCLSRESR